MKYADYRANRFFPGLGKWALTRHALWLGRWNLEIASLLHTAGSSLLPRCSCTASPLCSRLYFLCWRSKTPNFFFISICNTKGGLLISNHSPCYDDLSDSVITSPLRLALTTWPDTLGVAPIFINILLSKSKSRSSQGPEKKRRQLVRTSIKRNSFS